MRSIYAEVLDSLNRNQPVTMETRIFPEGGSRSLSRRLVPVDPAIDRQVTARVDGGCIVLREPFFPQARLIILGGGHVALAVCEFAAQCGFQTYVVDDRPDFASRDRFPHAARVICADFAAAIRELNVTPYDYVTIITRGHSHDADCLRTLLSGAFPKYLGMIGSRSRVRAQMELLQTEGFDEAKLSRICTPIGLPIGAVTPREIAVSILAELIAHKRLPERQPPGSFFAESDVEVPVLEHLARDHQPKAIVTLIEAKGSSPRGAGAKMAVDPQGRITGTIGGGLCEAAAIRDAVPLISTGGCRIVEYDMSGKVAENDGMVCGGRVKLLMEDGTDL